jgi:alpha-N-arabinofuranosidase
VVNATESKQEFDLNVTGVQLGGQSVLWQMTGDIVDAANHVGQPPQVEVKEISLSEAPKTLAVAPISITIYRFPIVQPMR